MKDTGIFSGHGKKKQLGILGIAKKRLRDFGDMLEK